MTNKHSHWEHDKERKGSLDFNLNKQEKSGERQEEK